MKRFRIIVAFMAVCLSMSAATKPGDREMETSACDRRINYTGRTLQTVEGVSFDWSGTSLRIRFEGRDISIRCSDTHGNWFNLWLDQEMGPREDKKIFVHSKDTVITLFEGLKKGVHEVILQKRTEGEQGIFTLKSVITEKGLLEASGRKERHIEFIGDSYTCGYGTEDVKGSHFSAATENCNLTYAAIVSRYFGASFNLVSHSGQGIARNYDDYRPGYNMVERYAQTFDSQETPVWDAAVAPYTPDIVVIYLGTNDFSTEKQPSLNAFTDKYQRLLKAVKENYGDQVPVVCMASKCDDLLFDYVRHAVRTSGLGNVAFFGMTDFVYNNGDELGSDWHPNYEGQRKVAMALIPYLSTVTGWPLRDKEIR